MAKVCCASQAEIEKEVSFRYDYASSVPHLCLSCGFPVTRLDIKVGETGLDIGSGAGTDVFDAAARVGSEGFVYGLDLSPEMLRTARKSRRSAGILNCRFIRGSADNIPLPDSAVDFVMSNCAMNHLFDKLKAFSEIFRVMKTGGRVAISDIYARKRLEPEIRRDPAMWAACVGGAVTKGEYLRTLQKAGFSKIKIVEEKLSEKKKSYGIMSFTFTAYKAKEVR